MEEPEDDDEEGYTLYSEKSIRSGGIRSSVSLKLYRSASSRVAWSSVRSLLRRV